MKFLMILSIFGLALSIILWMVSSIGLWKNKTKRRKIYLKMYHLAYYILLVSAILFTLLIFIG
ncbi:hypothetical protein [Staphylococcus aureus]|uniref:hypothetical protein n=1 Tax=Staphylococcus aureus TaxID=1280 RepID=UPI0038F8B06D